MECKKPSHEINDLKCFLLNETKHLRIKRSLKMPSLGRNQRFITATELMNRWGISELDLIAILSEYELRFRDASDLTTYAYDDRMLKTNYIEMMAFDLIDVERYEEKYPEYKPQEDSDPEPLDGKERQKFGQLNIEKLNWDE